MARLAPQTGFLMERVKLLTTRANIIFFFFFLAEIEYFTHYDKSTHEPTRANHEKTDVQLASGVR